MNIIAAVVGALFLMSAAFDHNPMGEFTTKYVLYFHVFSEFFADPGADFVR